MHTQSDTHKTVKIGKVNQYLNRGWAYATFLSAEQAEHARAALDRQWVRLDSHTLHSDNTALPLFRTHSFQFMYAYMTCSNDLQ